MTPEPRKAFSPQPEWSYGTHRWPRDSPQGLEPKAELVERSEGLSPARARRPAERARVHEEGLEPPHLAVPELKSGSEVSRCCQMSRNAGFVKWLATSRDISELKWTIRERFPEWRG